MVRRPHGRGAEVRPGLPDPESEGRRDAKETGRDPSPATILNDSAATCGLHARPRGKMQRRNETPC